MGRRDRLIRAARTVWTLGTGVMLDMPQATERSDPFELFGAWFDAAGRSGVFMHEAVCLATATPQGVPSARMMLLKGHGPDGFVLFTNYGSRKAGELDSNPNAALTFHWAALLRSIRIEGRVERLSREASDAYFQSRPRGSRIGAWASRQSQPLSSAAELQERVHELEQRFAGGEVPLPEFWGGYLVVPRRIEFWQGRAFRLHDRIRFDRSDEGGPWSAARLFP